VDLHIHTCLSPCATLDMTPRKIVKVAGMKDLGMIAVTDHNSAENVAATLRAAAGTDLCVIPGMEIATAEEAHIVALFDDVASAVSMQQLVYDHLPPEENDEDLFGIQVAANEFDEVEEINTRLLIGATTLGVEAVVSAIHQRGGLAVAAHIDRESFSVVGQLGFIPPDLALDALEISRRVTLDAARERFPEYAGYTFLPASDAHDLDEIGTNPTRVLVAEPKMSELRLALAGKDGRRVVTKSAA
jgi:predicted metal-dependent phosphoesterase TrpH